MESQRLLLAVLLSVAVIFIFGLLVPSLFAPQRSSMEVKKEKTAQQLTSNGATSAEWRLKEASEVNTWATTQPPKHLPAQPSAAIPLPNYPEMTAALVSDLARATFSTNGAAIVKLELLGPHYRDKGGQKFDMVSRAPETGKILPLLTFEGVAKDFPIPEDLPYKLQEEKEDMLVFSSSYGPWNVTRTFKMVGGYKIIATTSVVNSSESLLRLKPVLKVRKYKEAKREGGIMAWLNPTYNIPGGLCSFAGKTERRQINDLYSEPLSHAGMINFAAADDLYFLSAIVPLKGTAGLKTPTPVEAISVEEAFGCRVLVESEGVIAAELYKGESTLRKGESVELKVASYLGPKEYRRLRDFGYDLKTAIDYGWFEGLAVFFLALGRLFFEWTGNWGLAIILLTVVVKIILLPLTHWSYVSMRNMAAIKPLIDEINRRFPSPEDRDKKHRAIVELYKTHKVNPMMGCVPMLLQMPIWIALYSMLARSVELYRTPFCLWINDLSQRDPYFVLPILVGVSMFLQQKLTPTTVDSQQAKILLYFMPTMFTVFMLFLPSGLNLYILVSTVLTILQQKFMYKPKVATVEDKKVQLMAELDQKGIGERKKGK